MLKHKLSSSGRSTGFRTPSALLALSVAAAMYSATTASAVTTPQFGLFNTGIDPGVMMGVDAHYTVALEGATPLASPVTYKTDLTYLPFSPADDATSAFISPQPSYANAQADPAGYYDFTTTFDLTGVDLSKVSIQVRFESDDSVDNISLNGTALFASPLTPITTPGYFAFSDYYTLTSNPTLLHAGLNSVSFRLFNYPTTTGTDPVALRAEFLTAVPEPSAWAMVGGLASVMLFGGWLRRRRANA